MENDARSASPMHSGGITGPAPRRCLSGVVHALFLSRKPHLFDFEKFLYVYTAIDGCHWVWRTMNGRNPNSGRHGQRLGRLCAELGTSTPTWIDDVVDTRNDFMHQAIFFGEPLGFAAFRGNSAQPGQTGNTILELQSLVSRFICAILGLPCLEYISSPVNTRQIFGVDI